MKHLRALRARLAGLFAGRRADDDLRAELEAHLEMETAEYIRRGMSPAEARRQALLVSGGLTQAADAVRDHIGVALMMAAVGITACWVPALRASRVDPAVRCSP